MAPNATQQRTSPLLKSLIAQYPLLETVTKPNLKTDEAAFYLKWTPEMRQRFKLDTVRRKWGHHE